MRPKALVQTHTSYKKVIIYERPDAGTYLFLYTTPADTSCIAGYWFETTLEARDRASDMLGIGLNEWVDIGDPLPGIAHDREDPIPISVAQQEATQNATYANISSVQDQSQNLSDGSSLETADRTLIEDVEQLLRRGQHVTAIKIYRERAQVGLREAKAAVERLIDRMSFRTRRS